MTITDMFVNFYKILYLYFSSFDDVHLNENACLCKCTTTTNSSRRVKRRSSIGCFIQFLLNSAYEALVKIHELRDKEANLPLGNTKIYLALLLFGRMITGFETLRVRLIRWTVATRKIKCENTTGGSATRVRGPDRRQRGTTNSCLCNNVDTLVALGDR